jgi:DNA-binding CsgD family transcriptional regulator/tetratricopeptide (TPR) repeat protein
VKLLEREGALAALADARDAAARGEGRVVFVTGEPGIGKTSLVTRFVDELEAGARVLLGTCDDLSIPRPLGPLRDLAGTVAAPLEQALATGAAAHDVQSLLLSELERPPRPTVLVIEDVHWADNATLDTITVVGRRIRSLPALVVLTFRSGEAPPTHPLRAALGVIRADDAVFVELTPLSESAVASLAGDDSHDVYAATGGNPFYVTELLASRTADELPPSIANAVLGRAARLDDASRRLVELVSVVPSRVPTSLLDAVMPDWPSAAEQPERQHLLDVDARHVRFRHELARNAIRSSIPIAARRRLHAEILGALLAADADPADIVHHAEAAGATDVVAEYAIVAAHRAAALQSNREAYAHYLRAVDFLDRLSPAEQASTLEELAASAYLVNRLDDAFPAAERAAQIHAHLDDQAAVGRCLRILSRLHWFACEGAAARAKGQEAVTLLEALGESADLARAYSGMSQLAMLAAHVEDAVAWGERALELAVRVGDERTKAHALVNIGITRLQLDFGDTAPLLEAHAVAHAAGDGHEATRAIGTLAYNFMAWVEPEPAVHHARQALAYAREHEVHNLASYIATLLAWLQLRAGKWDEAERTTRGELETGSNVVQLLAKTVLAELAVRRGDPDAADRLADVASQADSADELQRIGPVLEAEITWALTTGAPKPIERLSKLLGQLRPHGKLGGCMAGSLVGWAAVAGMEADWTEVLPTPHAAMVRRDWQAAADAYGEVGWSFDRALMLSLLDDEASLVEALEIARALGAKPLTRHVTARLRELGFSVPHGPRETTRTNPAGLTARQLEVLTLLLAGQTNAEIAERLVVSTRTAEHHVAAVLAKLGAATRRDAAQRAAELGLIPSGQA